MGDDLDWNAISAGIEEEQRKLAEELGEPSPGIYEAIRPFNKSARERIEEAGMAWHYDLFYGTASDVVHMSAKAIDWLMDWDENRLNLRVGPDTGGVGVLTVATELMLRLLYKADEALESNHEREIDELAEEYWRINRKKGLELKTLIDAFGAKRVMRVGPPGFPPPSHSVRALEPPTPSPVLPSTAELPVMDLYARVQPGARVGLVGHHGVHGGTVGQLDEHRASNPLRAVV